MDFKLKGRRVLVTGASSGIGRATARLFAAEGATVALHGRDATRTEAAAAEIRAAGGEAWTILGDLRDKADSHRIAAAVEARGGVDVLVNNAATGGAPGKWFDAPDTHWRDLLESNVLGPLRITQALVPGMKARGWGRVINVGSTGATRPNPEFPAYLASKTALLNMTVSLAMELAGTGVTVNTVSPGGTRTEAMEEGLTALARSQNWPETEMDAIERRAVAELFPSPAGRMAHVDEVGATIVFIASEQAAYINGANVRVDGGYSMTIS